MNKPKVKQNPTILAILFCIGIAMLTLHSIFSIGPWLQSLTTKVEHPHDSTFIELDNLLKANVKDGRVNYQQTKNSPLLAAAVAKLAGFSPDAISDPKEKLCFWLNAYNLLVIKEISDRYPIARVQQLGNDPNLKKILVGGEPLSLQTVYMDKLTPLLRAEMPEALFVSCGGALGHPPILDHSIKSANLADESHMQAKAFICNTNNVGHNAKLNTFYLTPWLAWNAGVFAPKNGSVQNMISNYLSPELREAFEKPSTMKSYGRTFNWRINNQ